MKKTRFGMVAAAASAFGLLSGGVALAGPPASAAAAPRNDSVRRPVSADAAATPANAKPQPEAAEHPWVETSSDDGIKTYKREVPGSPIIALRGEGTVNAPMMRVASVLLDYSRATEWVDSVEELRVVRMIGPLEFIEYDHIATPPIILKDRDFVCHGKIELDMAQQVLTLSMDPVADPAVPETKYVRGELQGRWRLQAIDHGTRTLVTTEMHGDPKGSVAKWIVNFFQKDWPRNTLESLRKQVGKPDVKVIPQVQAAFEGKPLTFAIKAK